MSFLDRVFGWCADIEMQWDKDNLEPNANFAHGNQKTHLYQNPLQRNDYQDISIQTEITPTENLTERSKKPAFIQNPQITISLPNNTIIHSHGFRALNDFDLQTNDFNHVSECNFVFNAKSDYQTPTFESKYTIPDQKENQLQEIKEQHFQPMELEKEPELPSPKGHFIFSN